MRETKFRFYDIKNKAYEDLVKVFLSESGKYVLETISPFDADKRLPWTDNVFGTKLEDVLAVEQYTGMEDSGNTKIFEGDILMDVDSGYVIGSVEYIEDTASYWCGDDYLSDVALDGQVCGNIHENPELLEDE